MAINKQSTLDYSIKENRITIQKSLRQIYGLSEHPVGVRIPLEALEAQLRLYQEHYGHSVHWITLNRPAEHQPVNFRYTCVIRAGRNEEIDSTIRANTLYELIAKAVLVIDSIISHRIWRHEHRRTKNGN